MSLSRRSFSIFARIFAAAALVGAALQPAVPQARGKGAQAARGTGPAALRNGQEITFTSPQFVVHALWFKSNDETNWAWQGSDEVYAVFSDMDPTRDDRLTTVYGNVDEGDTENFLAGDRCMAPQPDCDRGMSNLNVRFSFWERDEATFPFMEFCYGDFAGYHYRLQNGKCSDDDLIGRGSIIYSREQLVAMLPTVGDSTEATAVMDKDAGKYRMRYRITRLADIERSIVIHLPDWDTRPSITVEGMVVMVNGEKRVRLTWAGATTADVDVYRNGAKLLTTPNDGVHGDPVANGTYQYRVCDLNSTTACSADVTIVVT